MGTPATIANELSLTIQEEMRVDAPLEATFAAILDEMGPHNLGEEDRPMPMNLEAWPGGRWYRDLGNDNGHLWGHVQAIKRPTLLEITGPLFMSYAAITNVQYRLTPIDGGTLISLKHSTLGLIPEDHREAFAEMPMWTPMLERVRASAEKKLRKK